MICWKYPIQVTFAGGSPLPILTEPSSSMILLILLNSELFLKMFEGELLVVFWLTFLLQIFYKPCFPLRSLPKWSGLLWPLHWALMGYIKHIQVKDECLCKLGMRHSPSVSHQGEEPTIWSDINRLMMPKTAPKTWQPLVLHTLRSFAYNLFWQTVNPYKLCWLNYMPCLDIRHLGVSITWGLVITLAASYQK